MLAPEAKSNMASTKKKHFPKFQFFCNVQCYRLISMENTCIPVLSLRKIKFSF